MLAVPFTTNMLLSIWWDMETCPLPHYCLNPALITCNIVYALHHLGLQFNIIDPFCAYADYNYLSTQTQHAFLGAGIRLHHIPQGNKDTKAMTILVDILIWSLEHSPPVHLMITTSNSDFANALHRLRMRRYNIILACPDGAPTTLTTAATTIVVWPYLLTPAMPACVLPQTVCEKVDAPRIQEANATQTTGSKPVATLDDVERWLHGFTKNMPRKDFEISALPIRFETETGRKLDYKQLGFKTLKDLLLNFCHRPTLKVTCAQTYISQPNDNGRWKGAGKEGSLSLGKPLASKEEFELWLACFSKTDIARKGLDISALLMLFEKETGKHLNFKHLGFTKLKNFLVQFEHLAVLKCIKPGQVYIFPRQTTLTKENNIIPPVNIGNSKTASLSTTADSGGQSSQAIKVSQTVSKEEFEDWLAFFVNTDVARKGLDVDILPMLFQKVTGKQLHLQQLGFNTLTSFLPEFKHLVVIKPNTTGETCIFPLRSISLQENPGSLHQSEILNETKTRLLSMSEPIDRRLGRGLNERSEQSGSLQKVHPKDQTLDEAIQNATDILSSTNLIVDQKIVQNRNKSLTQLSLQAIFQFVPAVKWCQAWLSYMLVVVALIVGWMANKEVSRTNH